MMSIRQTVLYLIVLVLVFFNLFSKSSTSQCNELKDCSEYINKNFPYKRKMLNGLKECLLENYTESEFRLIPPSESNEGFSIQYQYFLNELVSVEKDVAEINIVLNLFWKDDCLKWNETINSYFPYTRIMLNSTDIWRPQIFMPSRITQSFISKENDDSQIIVHSNGECELKHRLRLKIICEDLPIYFPNDLKICNISFIIKLITNFNLIKYPENASSCFPDNVETREWSINCLEFIETSKVISTTENWPFFKSSNKLYAGSINGTFKIRRYPNNTYSSIVLPSVILYVCSQLLSLIPPYEENYPMILSSLFLSLTMLLSNLWKALPRFNKFSILPIILNYIYIHCASTVLIIIVTNTINRRKKACLPFLQAYNLKICKFNAKPISFFLVASLSLTIPIIQALFLEIKWGFVSGLICLIIAWILLIRIYFSLRVGPSPVEQSSEQVNFQGNKATIEMDNNENRASKEITIDPHDKAPWNAKLALFICRIWNCFQIIGNIILNILLLVIYWQLWETSN